MQVCMADMKMVMEKAVTRNSMMVIPELWESLCTNLKYGTAEWMTFI